MAANIALAMAGAIICSIVGVGFAVILLLAGALIEDGPFVRAIAGGAAYFVVLLLIALVGAVVIARKEKKA